MTTALTIEIPTSYAATGAGKQRTALDGVEYVLQFDWNDRQKRWSFSLADQDEVPIVSGVTLVADWPLLSLVTDARRPLGELVAWDTSGAGLDPGLADLGDRVQFTYVPVST